MHIVRREKINNALFYHLSNGWYIMTAPCSRDRQGVERFSAWQPVAEAWGGVCRGGANTLRACLAEVERLSPSQSPPQSPEGSDALPLEDCSPSIE